MDRPRPEVRQMKILTHTVKPKIPAALAPLEEIARNLWLSWNFDAIMLFIRLDYDTWLLSHQNPAKMLGMVSQERFEQVAQDDSYLAALAETYERFNKYKEGHAWYQGPTSPSIAYFSMEYGMDVSLPIYSGGLGILSGDHMKTASDLGLPLVGVGLLYRQGYFKQYLNADGFQQESYPENDWYNMPVVPRTDAKGQPVKIGVELAGETAVARVWEAKVGRARLVLLDTNIEENAPHLRDITATLYGGDKETRIRQEILLGMGGVRALRALGVEPAVTHMNEGHSAFLALERIRELMDGKKLGYQEALQAVKRTNIFTTHTPVPAGNERFAIDLVEKYFRQWIARIGLSWEDFLALGRENPADPSEQFCMTVLALKCCDYANGVSELHGAVSRTMWKNLWPGLPEREVPIGHVTNGVHPRTWISNNMLELLDRYFGPRFDEEPENLELWQRMARISDEELWRTHERRRERLVVFARDRLRTQLKAAGFGDKGMIRADDALSPYALTISFARRFATYKRGDLLLRDPDRLIRLLQDADRPIQLIFAGKAHPHDIPGKGLIRDIVHFTRRPEVQSRIVFLEDYDMTMARYMTSGSDLWLNTPRRPLEASGTSGMKAGMNGVLNCSVLDGWWAEAYNPDIGWAIGSGETYDDEELQDEVESKALYDLLEREIIPTFYQRGRDGLPREWIARMKASMATVGADFSCHRMLIEYSKKYYYPALEAAERLRADDYAEVKGLADYLSKAKAAWKDVEIGDFATDAKPVTERGENVTVSALVKLGSLTPDGVEVELYHGSVSSMGEISVPERHAMTAVGKKGDYVEYKVQVPCSQTGRQGYALRVLPRHPALAQPFQPGLIRWA
jgi:starch phosphorylase